LAAGLAEAISSSGLPAQVPACRTLFGIYFADEPVTDYDGAKRAASNGLYAPFFHAMLARGVALAPSAYEVGFCSMAHSDADIDRTVEAAADAAREVAAVHL
jgi:glutamate-1-semialdehyde 2,1-aminomutase